MRRHPRANAHHLGAWASILRAAYGYRPAYLAIEDGDGGLRGVLPLLSGTGVAFGRRLSSMPGAWSSGPLGDDRQVEARLLVEAVALAQRQRARRLIVRSTAGGLEAAVPALEARRYPPKWVLPLPAAMAELEDRWRTDKHLRRNLRKAEASELTVREGTSVADLRGFYSVYLRTARRLRLLPRRRRQLVLAREALGPVFRLFLVEDRSEMVAAAVFYAFGDTLEMIFSASDERRLALRPNHALYRESIRWAIEHGFRHYDFGGAGEGTGLGNFKRQWGARPQDVYIYGWAAKGGSPPVAEAQEIPSNKLIDMAWPRVPLAGVELAGVLAYRYL